MDDRCEQQVADALPNGRHRVLESQEHVVPPEVLVPVLTEFFSEEEVLSA